MLNSYLIFKRLDSLSKVSNIEVGREQNIFGSNFYRVTNHVFLDQSEPAERGGFRINGPHKVSKISKYGIWKLQRFGFGLCRHRRDCLDQNIPCQDEKARQICLLQTMSLGWRFWTNLQKPLRIGSHVKTVVKLVPRFAESPTIFNPSRMH